jgi:hypothetical protein
MLQRFNQFYENILLENLVNESVIYFSPDFRKILSRMGDEISKNLLEIEATDIKPDVTFVDLDPNKNDYLSFTTMKNAIKVVDNDRFSHLKRSMDEEPQKSEVDSRKGLIDQFYYHPELSQIFKKSRNPIRIGKFVNRVLNNKYNPKEIEEFVNKLKSKRENSAEIFLMVEGDDIAFWYKTENYAEIKGNLGNSCMREKPSSFFEIYTKNPQVCRMLVLLEDDKLIGRALIWKLSYISKEIKEELYFMDRQYTIKESDVDKFRSYADENEWAYKTNNNHYSLESITYKDEIFDVNMRVDLKNIGYDKFPYMDTFRRYNPSDYSLFNDEKSSSDYEGDYILDKIDGTYRGIEGGVWSEWHDRMIDEDQAVWSYWADSYLDSDNDIYIDNGSGRNHGWYPEGCEDLVWDEWNDITIHVDDTVYSDALGHPIYDGDAVEVIEDIDYSDGEPIGADSNWYPDNHDDIINLDYDIQNMAWYKRLSDKFSDWDTYSYAKKSLFIKNYQDNWILAEFEIPVFKVMDDNSDIEYLLRLHADILKVKISNESLIMDKFEYFEIIEDVLPNLFKLLSDKEEDLKSRLKDNDDKDYQKLTIDEISILSRAIGDIRDGVFIDFEED